MDLDSHLDDLYAQYPSARPRVRAAVRAMRADFECAAHRHCYSTETTKRSSDSCYGSNNGREKVPAARQNRRTADTAAEALHACSDHECQTERGSDFSELKSNAVSRRSSGDVGSLGGVGGGWSREERVCFGRLRQDCFREAAAQGGGREAALQLLAAALPGKTLEEVRAHDNRCETVKP